MIPMRCVCISYVLHLETPRQLEVQWSVDLEILAGNKYFAELGCCPAHAGYALNSKSNAILTPMN